MKIRTMALVSTTLATILPISVHAQTSSAPDFSRSAKERSTDIVVTAQRQAKTARAEEQAAPNVVNIQSAETIAKYPDINAAEALSRIPGVALSIDTAEGRFVNIRGLDGNLNGATFGGVVLLNTQPGGTYFNASGRAVEFDTVPVGAIDRIVVTKTGLPDHDAEGLGGTVELTPRTAIGAKRPFLEVTLGGGVQPLRGHGLYRDEVVFGAPFGGTNAEGNAPFSVVLTQFLYNDRRSFDDLEAAYINDQPATPDKAFDALELRNYNYNRKRFGFSGEFDFTPNDNHRLYARVSIAGYNESVHRLRLEIDGLADGVVVDPANPNGFVVTAASTVKTLRDEDETHRNVVYQIGGEHRFNDIKLDWFGAYSRATYVKHFDYNSNFNGPDRLAVGYDNITNPDFPTFRVLGGASITDSANYSLARITNQIESDRDREWSGAINLSTPLHLLDDDQLKFGAKLRLRRKIAAPQSFRYNYGGPAASLSSFATGAPITDFYGLYAIGQDINASAVRSFLTTTFNPAAPGAATPLFDDSEDVIAGYAQYKAVFGNVSALAGVRVENTHSIYRGTTVVTPAAGADIVTATSQSRSYTNVFPTIQLRYQPIESVIARATWSTGIARPGFFQTINNTQIDVGAGTVSTGNPALKPTYGNNFDLAFEYAPSADTFVSIGLFDKEFQDYIVTRTVRGSFPGITGIATIDTFSNISGAHARGIEVAGSTKFSGLPGLFSGFGIDANGSYVTSAGQIRPGESITLPGTFNYTANGALFYEARGLKLRLAGQYESAVLFGIGGSRATDVFQDKRLTLDFNGSYDVNRHLGLFVNLKNLTDEPLRFYEGSANRPIQREFYDLTFEGGVKLRF
ncbi:MAG: TonB-dependent receptor [Sphingomonas sp. 28-66-16]|nr:MAG: TonB-dependent receptor [Sphingomonas sp. 28-66-16]